MRIRPVWIAVPACAAAGVFTYSFVAAQDAAKPAGYYTPRVTPHPSVAADQQKYIRPLNDSPPPASSADLPPPSITWTPPGMAKPPVRQVAPPAAGQAKPKAVAYSDNGPLPPARPKFFPDAAPASPPAIKQVGGTGDASPLPSPTLPNPPIAAPTITIPTVLPPSVDETKLPPPKVSLESPPVGELPKNPAVEVPKTPVVEAPKMAPAVEAPKPLPAVGVVEKPAVAAFPASTPLPPRQAPSIVLDTVAPESVGVGQSLSYELVVRNTGASAVGGVRIDDDLPTGATFVSSDPVAEQSGTRLTWQLGTLDGGAEKRVKVTVKPSDEGELRSRAVATFTTAAEARVKVTRPRIGVVANAADAARVGDEVPITIKLSNTGSGSAQKLVIQAKLSDGLVHQQGSVIEAEVGPLAAGETKPLTLRATATKAGPQSCVITVMADGNPPEQARVAVAAVEPLLNLKVAGPAKCLVRAEPTYTLELTNPGTAATDPVQAWAVVPDGFEFVTAGDGGTFTPANRTVVWKLPALPAGGTKALTMKLRASGPVDGTLKAVAQASTDSAQPAGGVVRAAGSNRVLEAKADAVVKAEGVPALRFEVSDVDDPVEVGKEAVYEIKVVNQGTAACTNVLVAATLADGTTVAGVNGPTAGRGAGQTVSFDPVPTLNVKGEVVFQVRVKGGTAGDLRFKVQVSCDQIKSPVQKEENTRFYKE